MKTVVKEIPVDQIVSDPENRNFHSEESIQAMGKNIERYGLIHPITVWKANSQYQIIQGERRWRAVKRLGRETIRAEVTIEKPTVSYIRGIRISENRMREFDWMSEVQETFDLYRSGMKFEDIKELFGFRGLDPVARRLQVGELLEEIDTSLKDKARDLDFAVVREVASVVGTRLKFGDRPRESILTERDIEIAKEALLKALEKELTSKEARAEAWRLKYLGLEESLEEETVRIQEEQDKLLTQRQKELEEAFEERKKAEIKEEVAKVETSYKTKLEDAGRSVRSLEAKLDKKDKLSAQELKKLRKSLSQAREAKDELERNLAQEKSKIEERLKKEYTDKLQRAVASEKKKIKQDVEKALKKRAEAVLEQEKQLELEWEKLQAEARDLKAKKKHLEDRAVVARQVQKNIIKKLADLLHSLAGIDDRYLDLLEPEEKIELAQELLKGTLDIERVVFLIREQKDVPRKKIELKGLKKPDTVDIESD